MTRVDTLIRGGIVLTMDPARRALMPGFVAVRDGRIVAVDTGDGAVFDAGKTIDASGHVVLPGLINAHCHLIQTLYRGLGDEFAQSAWPRHIVFRLSTGLTEEHAYNGARLALLELLNSGVTTTADSHFTHVHKDSIDGVCRAVAESGMRAIISRAAMDSSPGAPEEAFWEDIEIAIVARPGFRHSQAFRLGYHRHYLISVFLDTTYHLLATVAMEKRYSREVGLEIRPIVAREAEARRSAPSPRGSSSWGMRPYSCLIVSIENLRGK